MFDPETQFEKATARGPRLSDGVRVADLIDLEERTVCARLHSDEEIYRLEMERIFGRCWIAVAHESEIPNPGDYVTRAIGEDPVIVSRDRSGGINILLNTCSHRGMNVCRAEMGNTKFFRCPYHAWSYDATGRLVSVSAEQEMYDGALDKEKYGLRRARVATYAGMVFGTWSEEAPPLKEELGGITFYLDMAFNRSRSGLEVLGPPQRWTFDANWKLAAEQFSGDAYHTVMLHNSLAELGVFPKDPAAILLGVNVGTEGAHTLRCLDMEGVMAGLGAAATEGMFDQAPPPGMDAELVAQVTEVLSTEQVNAFIKTPPVVGQVFPTLAWINMLLPNAASEIKGGVITFRTWVPRGLDHMEIMSWTLVEKDASEEIRRATARSTIQTFSDSGIFEQDDAESWAGVYRAIRGAQGQKQRLLYFSTCGEPIKENGCLTWPGMGRDDIQWLFWKRYRELMEN
ncbi:aromatic ring-hydroxylating oxygenase subunit alpha [Mycobacterium vicinigordonae]|uniref:Rieske 2Fe-2S domain-containing protein n=1 Tax=Mycobacterium vicinigordonae TaxID=1719132 RepID=A0A7D6E3T8_9MYCO|nr:Rieske 2Fe-2S domain-containing protein [Mycobacterium vicinigordonae]QLL06240.1 Rieske 2Fe-2S domain-containing protein [Mycobacterium vicinigordonae]QLL06243.1 Rieske 2Fe-2S domain-containing protein [Mycobacterium vicinigordonae]